jgi:protein-S-isoprenylcysteine O-methyltransferase Ste14
MRPLEISDQRSPDFSKTGAWLFRHRTALPLPIAAALLLIRSGETASSWTLAGTGVVLTAAGEAIRFWAVHHIGVISRTRSGRLGPLVDSGPFALVRNPPYIGNILLWVGFTLTAQLVWLAPLVALLLALEYHAIVRWEEQLLEARYGPEYRAYAARVPRWAPNATNLNAARRSTAADATFSWRETLFSERGTLLAIAAGYVLLWIKAQI